MKPAPPPLLYFKNAAGQLLQDPAGFLRVTWSSGPRQSEEVKAIFSHMIVVLRRHNWCRILINQVGMQPFLQQEQQWIAQEWLPLAVQAGYRYGAVVVSPDVMVRLATAYITTQVQNLPLLYRSFESEVQAAAWLQQQPATAGPPGSLS